MAFVDEKLWNTERHIHFNGRYRYICFSNTKINMVVSVIILNILISCTFKNNFLNFYRKIRKIKKVAAALTRARFQRSRGSLANLGGCSYPLFKIPLFYMYTLYTPHTKTLTLFHVFSLYLEVYGVKIHIKEVQKKRIQNEKKL